MLAPETRRCSTSPGYRRRLDDGNHTAPGRVLGAQGWRKFAEWELARSVGDYFHQEPGARRSLSCRDRCDKRGR